MTLDLGTIGFKYQVSELYITGGTGHHLEALGLTRGTKIELLNKKRNGAVIFKVRGTRLAVGKQIAKSIEVKEV